MKRTQVQAANQCPNGSRRMVCESKLVNQGCADQGINRGILCSYLQFFGRRFPKHHTALILQTFRLPLPLVPVGTRRTLKKVLSLPMPISFS